METYILANYVDGSNSMVLLLPENQFHGCTEEPSYSQVRAPKNLVFCDQVSGS